MSLNVSIIFDQNVGKIFFLGANVSPRSHGFDLLLFKKKRNKIEQNEKKMKKKIISITKKLKNLK